MQIVYDNIIFSLQHLGGISTVWGNLLQNIAKHTQSISFIEYDKACDNQVRRGLDLRESSISLYSSKWMKIKRLINPQKPINIGNNQKFIFHSSYYRICKHPNAINITTVHDFTYYLYEKNPIIRYLNIKQQFDAIKKSDYVVCISENTRKDLMRILPSVSPEKLRVIYNGADKRFNIIENAPQEDYVLYVGKRDKYKNFNNIIEPLSKVNRTIKIVGVPLTDEEIALMNRAGLKYDYCGFVTDEELNRLYNSAFCLIYSSLYEGFGLPVVEAQMAGCPVIALNSSSIPEVIADSRTLLNSITLESIQEKLTLLQDTELRAEIIKKGLEHSKRFSWEKMTTEYFELYKEALEK